MTHGRLRKLSLAAVLVGAIGSMALPGADAGLLVVRVSFVTTDNCNDPATSATPAGLCQANNPSQPGGNNLDFIAAQVKFVDDGTTLTGSGVGKGFRPNRVYVSLLYLNPTVQTCARFPAGTAATPRNTALADNDFNSMFLGFWTVGADGSGKFSVYPGKLSPLGNLRTGQTGLAAYGTVSVREAAGGFLTDNGGGPVLGSNATDIATNIVGRTGGGVPLFDGADTPPNIFQLKSCGTLVAPGVIGIDPIKL